MTNDKGIGSKAGAALPPITESTLAAPSPAAPAPAPAAPTGSDPATLAAPVPTPSPAPSGDSTAVLPTTLATPSGSDSGARTPRVVRSAHRAARRRRVASPETTEPQGSPETEQPSLNADDRRELEKLRAEKEKAKKDPWSVRAKKWGKEFAKKWGKRLGIILVIFLAGYFVVNHYNLFGVGKDTGAASQPRLSAPKGIMPGGDDGAQRGIMASNNPTVKEDGDALTFEYADPSYPNANVTFQVITDNDLNIREVRLGDKLKEEYGGKLSIGTVDGSREDDVRCSHTAQSCDISKENINLCKSWLLLSRIIPIAGGSDQEQPFWTSLQVYNATPVGTYTGSADLPHHCGVKDSDTSS